jgi:hypothetical protein
MQLSLFAPLYPLTGNGGAIGGEMLVLCRQFMPHRDFELRFSSNDTCPVGVYREIAINNSPSGGAIGFSNPHPFP